ncbi:DeoR/GlpR family DNA-binding transcription regulator [Streptomyces sp. NPDC050428]|uniref:DeoR/GlpR family DNA-binding transcription regulator n=1 Tax=Streptomyces sp. NPDC050428 TaxID=3155757 RepID=UPI0034265AD2
MNRYERHNTLLELLAERGRLDVDDVAAELSVSAATVRRDLDHLAEQQLLTRTRGGAFAHSVSYGLPPRYKSVNIAHEPAVRPHIKIVTTGGVAMPQSYELVGPLARHILGEVSLDIAFIGADAVDVEAGAGARNEHEASINALLAARACRLVVVADSSKLGAPAFARICRTEAIDTLITDAGAPEQAALFEERGVSVVQV